MKPASDDARSAPVDHLRDRLRAQGVDLDVGTLASLVALIDRLLAQKQNLTAITDPIDALDRHLVDSLVALSLEEVREADTIVDIGSGGGFPGLPLAAVLTSATVTLVESEKKKAAWLMRCVADFPNLRVVADRSEQLAQNHREEWRLACVRAVAAPAVALELAAPLVVLGGTAVLWRSADADPTLDAHALAAARILGFQRQEPLGVEPFPGARRMLDRYRKVAPTPERFPRRPGRAAKRPLGVDR
ncbi:MAG TPA: class I SAM-dependent methyltransferase [Miltoncostaeaceae bacterium]|nr:class I SAM-dependent methyltransferase [Miltoncostaeaceae bacterium]